MVIRCAFDNKELPEGTEKFFCDDCEAALLSTMSEQRKLGFRQLNPYALGIRQEMTPGEVAAFERTFQARNGFAQTLQLLDPGDPTNPDDRNSHLAEVPLSGVPFESAAGIEPIADAALAKAEDAAMANALLLAKTEWDRRQAAAKDLADNFTDLMTLQNVYKQQVPVAEIATAMKKSRIAAELSTIPLEQLEEEERARAWPYDRSHTILRVKRDMDSLAFTIAIKFPTTGWEFIRPYKMDEAKFAERERLIRETLASGKGVQRVNLDTKDVGQVDAAMPAGTAAPAA